MSIKAPSVYSTMAWEPNKRDVPTMLGRYRILGTVGKGGMGVVFKGFHLDLDRDVAIKTMRIDKIHSADVVDRFRREIKLIGRMDHENIVRATDAGEKNGVFYLVMEFLSGYDLHQLVVRNGPLPCADACELIRQAALGLEYIHRTLVHRDIKPSNLMLTTSGQVKILDLGLAHCDQDALDDRYETPAGMVLGTRFYMAPEQARSSRTIDGRADIYSLGCTLFKLVTGTEPFSSQEYCNSASQIYAHCHVQLPTVPAFEAVPEELRAVLLRMMAKNPDERYQTAREVADALAPLAVGSASAILGAAGAGEPTVHPLALPLPEELGPLTQSVGETPCNTTTLSSLKQEPPRRKVGWLLPACALAAVLAVVGWIFAPALLNVVPNRKIEQPAVAEPLAGPTEIRNLDELEWKQNHWLLDQRPFTLGSSFEEARVCQWNKGAQEVDVIRSTKTLFFLGKTARSRFTFDVAINQAPWTGNIGVFWGYREDEQAKKDEQYKKDGTFGPYFAWFQLLLIKHRTDGNQGDIYSVARSTARVRWNKQGQLAISMNGIAWPEQTFPLKSGSTILQIEIDGSRLRSANLGAVPLNALHAPNETEPCQGGLGLIALTHAGSFSRAKIYFHSKN